jgi:pimeloyl-ACP methyl ester carboxylesterase
MRGRALEESLACGDNQATQPARPPRVPTVQAGGIRDCYINVDGIRTHYLEAGDGDPIVLLHSGEFGGRAELSWEYVMPMLAESYRVIAPDWLGYGGTAKIHDFGGKRARMMSHMRRTLEVLAIENAHLVGNSMGATYLAKMVASPGLCLQARSITLISGGGFAPDNAARRATLEYDCTREAMVRLLQALFTDPVWWTDDSYVDRRQAAATEPGAWEALAVARFRSPLALPRTEFGQADDISYEDFRVPALFIAGADDKLREPHYADGPASRAPSAKVVTLPGSGHCPNIEQAADVAELLLRFFKDTD